MKHRKIGNVMTSDVVRVGYGTPFKEVAGLLADHRISGLPVVDAGDKVIGVIPETDLMTRQAEPAGERGESPGRVVIDGHTWSFAVRFKPVRRVSAAT